MQYTIKSPGERLLSGGVEYSPSQKYVRNALGVISDIMRSKC